MRPFRVQSASCRLATAALVLLAAFGCRPPDDIPRPDSVIIITIDTLRADHVGAYGYERDTTPNIDRFARTATRFDLAFAQRGLTLPALASLMTGQHPYRHGVVRMYKAVLPDSAVTLAELFKDEGLETVAFSSHLALARDTGFAQGFDEYHLFHSDHEAQMAERAAAWLSDHQDERVFFWYHSFGPHSPYQAPGEWGDHFADPEYAGDYTGDQAQMYEIGLHKNLADADRQHLIDLYDGKVRWIDHHLAPVLEVLDRPAFADHAVVVVSSDHGEELFDHFLYFSHEASVHDGTLRIPLFIRTPGQTTARVAPGVAQQIAIAPTLLDLAGVDGADDMQGHSLRGALSGGQLEPDVAFGSIDHDSEPLTIHSARTARWRYIRNPRGYVPGWNISYPPEGLYDLAADPGATRNVASQHPDVTRELRDHVTTWAEANPWSPPAPGEPSKETTERLRALGYVEDQAERGATVTE